MRTISPEKLAQLDVRQAAEAAALAAFRATMTDAAAALGWAIHDDEPNGWGEHRCTNGDMSINARLDHARRRITLFGYLPGELARYARGVDITVAAERPAADIAREIQRRLLPPLEHQLTEARTQHAKDQAEAMRVKTIAERIAAAGASEARTGGYGRSDSYTVDLGGRFAIGLPNPYGSAEVNSWGEITMTLRKIPPELAEHIASLLGEYRTEG